LAGVQRVEMAADQSGTFAVTLDDPGGTPANEALVALIGHGLAILSYELEGARLSDAFLAMTEAA
jgi:hypothetical protein